MTSLFIFRRDFRLNDNLGLIECYKKSNKVIPIFIFTPEQIEKNSFFSSNSFQFMLESLEELNDTLNKKYNSKIHYYYGDNVDVLKNIYKKCNYDSIFFNMDYTPYAINRDKLIKEFCEENKIDCIIKEDYLLMPMGTFLKENDEVYQKYTPFKNNAKKFDIMSPNNYKFNDNKFDNIKTTFHIDKLNKYYVKNDEILVRGGRENAMNILKDMNQFSNYVDIRNKLQMKTTHLSAYIKYGCVSIREVFHTVLKLFGINHGIIDQLLWREFYFYLAFYIPRVLEQKSLKPKYDDIKWENNLEIFEAWKNGNTGFPGVDAGMREMNKTGFMHNRARLITSGILIKILNCDWRLGEKYFATKLVDYDPSVNNGNWQWSSGSGADSQPYFRILSPWKQTLDNDPECEYIKKWIPELKNVNNKDIHNWDKNYSKYDVNYPKPIVDYNKMRKDIIEIYKKGIS